MNGSSPSCRGREGDEGKRGGGKASLPIDSLTTYPELFLQLGNVGALGRHVDVVKLPFILGEKAEPSFHRVLDDLAHAEGQRAHEVIARGAVPVPNLQQESAIFIFRAKFTVGRKGMRCGRLWASERRMKLPQMKSRGRGALQPKYSSTGFADLEKRGAEGGGDEEGGKIGARLGALPKSLPFRILMKQLSITRHGPRESNKLQRNILIIVLIIDTYKNKVKMLVNFPQQD